MIGKCIHNSIAIYNNTLLQKKKIFLFCCLEFAQCEIGFEPGNFEFPTYLPT